MADSRLPRQLSTLSTCSSRKKRVPARSRTDDALSASSVTHDGVGGRPRRRSGDAGRTPLAAELKALAFMTPDGDMETDARRVEGLRGPRRGLMLLDGEGANDADGPKDRDMAWSF